ncbi:uncharacterized protein PSFLO_00673 [Pseudozyma flocculosa]|uniref:Glycosyl hydrolase n=1 Tax=Pseudozyma flocculosa TaxID=84751 RepID=A0A5C3ET31_9BASI|nr:uncharacterized protein PSFLO_00673 [Pseudozyma flocculosa]
MPSPRRAGGSDRRRLASPHPLLLLLALACLLISTLAQPNQRSFHAEPLHHLPRQHVDPTSNFLDNDKRGPSQPSGNNKSGPARLDGSKQGPAQANTGSNNVAPAQPNQGSDKAAPAQSSSQKSGVAGKNGAARDASDDATSGNLTSYVNVFVGTAQNGDPGNVFAGGTVPFGMAKVGLNVEGYSPAGYVSDNVQPTRGVSPLHDSGTGSSDGSYGNFCVMPVTCKGNDLDACPTLLDSRLRFRKNGTDVGRPGYFATMLNNSIGIELTSTRRATLERYTFPTSLLDKEGSTAHLVLDWTNDSPGTFRNGTLDVDWQAGRLKMSGSWRSSFGPSFFSYNAYQCVDLLYNGKQNLGNHAVFGGDRLGMDAKRTDVTHWTRIHPNNGQPIQAGVVVGFKSAPAGDKGQTVTIRRGVSFVSAEHACQNMEEEIPDWDFDKVAGASNDEWEDKLKRIELATDTDPLCLLFHPTLKNNATETDNLRFDGEYCTWDTFRTLFPFMALSSPRDFADIVEDYIDGYRKEGYLPECRANQVKGYVQGGNHGVEVLADFANKYRHYGDSLGVSLKELYEAMVHDIDVASPDFEYEGRQAVPFQKYGYIPYGYLDTVSVGEPTREISRSLEYSYGDFTAAVTAQTLNQSQADVARFRASALNYRKNYDHSARSDGFSTFVQQRYANGTFRRTDPTTCSPKDTDSKHSCSLQPENTWGIYESSSWEYSLYAPQDGAGLVQLLGGKDTFERRLDHFFQAGYYQPGNEPSFDTPSQYHHIGKPYKSVRRVRNVIGTYFGLGTDGVPGNDDNAAMASLLSWYLLGFYPVPGTREMLILSPLVPSYTVHNELLGDLTVTVTNFDPRSVQRDGKLPSGARAFVKSVRIDGQLHPSICRISFDDFFPAAAAAAGGSTVKRKIEIEVTSQEIDGCGQGEMAQPMSLSTGGFLGQVGAAAPAPASAGQTRQKKIRSARQP